MVAIQNLEPEPSPIDTPPVQVDAESSPRPLGDRLLMLPYELVLGTLAVGEEEENLTNHMKQAARKSLDTFPTSIGAAIIVGLAAGSIYGYRKFRNK